MTTRAVAGWAPWGVLSLVLATLPVAAMAAEETTMTLGTDLSSPRSSVDAPFPSSLFTPSTSSWDLETLRPVYSQSFAWSRALRDGVTTPTQTLVMKALQGDDLQLALAAELALQDSHTTTSIPLERLLEVRSHARTIPFQVPDLPWAARPLLDAAERLDAPSQLDWLPRDLLDQLVPDDIPGNAESAGEIYALGLQQDSERFLPPLLARWERFQGSFAEATQAETIIATLLLTHASASTPPPQDEEWRETADRLGRGPARRLRPLDRADTREVQEVAAWCLRHSEDWSLDEFEQGLREANKWLAWRFLEESSPMAESALAEMLRSDDVPASARFRAALLWLTRSPWTLAEPSNAPLFANAIAARHWRNWALASLLAGDANAYELDSLRLPRTTLPPLGSELADMRAPLLEAVRNRLAHEGVTDAQIALWDFLEDAHDDQAVDAISHAAIANLADDDDWGNASAASWALARLGPRAVPAAIAGLEVAAQMDDWQMAANCYRHLREYDPGFDAAAHPEVMDLMATQLADDDTDGNALAGAEYLAACGGAALPYLDDLEENGDEQEKRLAARIRQEINGE